MVTGRWRSRAWNATPAEIVERDFAGSQVPTLRFTWIPNNRRLLDEAEATRQRNDDVTAFSEHLRTTQFLNLH